MWLHDMVMRTMYNNIVSFLVDRFYTYGNLPLEKHLEQINGTLSQFDKIDPKTEVPAEPRWDAPVSIYLSLDLTSSIQ